MSRAAAGGPGSREFPKGKPIGHAGNGRFASGRKSSIVSSTLVRLTSHLAGSTTVNALQGAVFLFRILFFTFLRSHFSNGPMKSIYLYIKAKDGHFALLMIGLGPLLIILASSAIPIG